MKEFMTFDAPALSAVPSIAPDAPDMTPLTQALKIAGVQLPPLNKRVWLWLHDHPDKTSTEVANALKVPMSGVSSVLGDMAKRMMCLVRTDSSKNKRGSVLRYKTLGKTFELLPKPFTAKHWTMAAPPAPDPVPVPAPEPDNASETFAKLTAQRVLDTLNVREALVLYRELHNLFSSASSGDAANSRPPPPIRFP